MTLQQQWSDLVVHNPMLVEFTRFRRRFLAFNGSPAMKAISLAIIGACYLSILALIAAFRKDVEPVGLVEAEALILTLIAPVALHASIAGERERRSWDVLMAAPITKAQVVVGKFLGSLGALGIVGLFCSVPVAICAFGNEHTDWWDLGLAHALAISFISLVCALTLFFSSRTNRAFAALGTSIGVMFLALAVFPTLILNLMAGAGRSRTEDMTVAMFFHPGFVMEEIRQAGSRGNNEFTEHLGFPTAWAGWPQTIVYFALTVLAVRWTIKTLTASDGGSVGRRREGANA